MTTSELGSGTALGFLTVLEHPQHGLFGGYLVLNLAGRPLEFHCTAPVKPNRAQEILYGPTLQSFLYGEQIGQTLLQKSKAQPLLLCVDRQPILAVRQYVSIPVALVLCEDGPTQDQPLTCDCQRLATFELGRNRLAAFERTDDCQVITERIGELSESFDLAEPFSRIREAIEEAQKAARPSCPAA